MPALSKGTEATRILQAMQALQLMIRGMDKKQACETVGLSEWQFEQWIAQENNAIEDLQKNIVEAERIRMAQLANAQAILLATLLQTVTLPGYPDQDMQLKVLKYIDNLRGDLEQKHGVHSQTDEAEQYAMNGPKTRVEASKMHVQHEMSKSTVNIKTRADGSVDLTIPTPTKIIDIFPELDDSAPASEE